MAVVQISQIKHRRGLQSDLPQLGSAELGWSLDTQKLYIGNGDLSEGSPEVGNTRVLTEKDLPFANSAVVSQTISNNTTANVSLYPIAPLNSSYPGVIMNYVITRSANVRTGTLRISQLNSKLAYDEEYTETGNIGFTFTVTQISNTYAQLSANTTNTGYDANLKFSFTTVTF